MEWYAGRTDTVVTDCGRLLHVGDAVRVLRSVGGGSDAGCIDGFRSSAYSGQRPTDVIVRLWSHSRNEYGRVRVVAAPREIVPF